MGEATLEEKGDWTQYSFTIAHNGVFIVKTHFNPVELHVLVSLSDDW